MERKVNNDIQNKTMISEINRIKQGDDWGGAEIWKTLNGCEGKAFSGN